MLHLMRRRRAEALRGHDTTRRLGAFEGPALPKERRGYVGEYNRHARRLASAEAKESCRSEIHSSSQNCYSLVIPGQMHIVARCISVWNTNETQVKPGQNLNENRQGFGQKQNEIRKDSKPWVTPSRRTPRGSRSVCTTAPFFEPSRRTPHGSQLRTRRGKIKRPMSSPARCNALDVDGKLRHVEQLPVAFPVLLDLPHLRTPTLPDGIRDRPDGIARMHG